MADFYCIPTLTGAAKIAAAASGGPAVTLTHYSVGDASGVPYAPLTRQSADDLVNEQHMDVLESVTQSTEDARVYIARIRIPAAVGGWNICEIGLIDSDGDLIYLANYPNNYKPTFSQGAGGELVIPVYMMTDAADTIEVVADPEVITATQAWVQQQLTAASVAARIAIGDLYFTTVPGRDPAVFLGYGTWEPYAQGRALVGVLDADADFGTLGQTGGAKTHTLTAPQLAPHAHKHSANIAGTGGGTNQNWYPADYDPGANYNFDSSQTGEAEPHNNLQPYIVIAVWRRTA